VCADDDDFICEFSMYTEHKILKSACITEKIWKWTILQILH